MHGRGRERLPNDDTAGERGGFGEERHDESDFDDEEEDEDEEGDDDNTEWNIRMCCGGRCKRIRILSTPGGIVRRQANARP